MNTTVRPETSPDAARLALKLVEWHYGHLCKEVMSALIKYGRQTLRELAFLSKISVPDLRTALLVLIQQNCASSYLVETEQSSRQQFVYEADLRRTLQILRMPHFLERTALEFEGEDFAPLAQLIIQALLFNGRLRLGQMTQAVASLRTDSETRENRRGIETFPSGAPDPHLMKKAVRALVNERFIERAPPCTLPPPVTQIHLNAQKRRGSRESRTADEHEALMLQAEHENRWKEYWKNRFECEQLLRNETFEMPSSNNRASIGRQSNTVIAGSSSHGKGKRRKDGGDVDEGVAEVPQAKRHKGSLRSAANNYKTPLDETFIKEEEELDGDAHVGPTGGTNLSWAQGGNSSLDVASMNWIDEQDALTPMNAVVWRVNHMEYNRRFRNEEVIRLARAHRYSTESTIALEALLFATLSKETGSLSDETPSVSIQEIVQASERLHGKQACISNASEATTYLNAIVAQSSEQLVAQIGNPPLYEYVAGVGWALGSVRRAYVRTEVHKRFGSAAQRIWNMLFEDGQMEQKMIADKAMVQPQEARKALFAMLRDGFISLQDIPKSADRAPSRTVYTFRATMAAVKARMGCMLYKTAGNLLSRLEKEMVKHSDLLERIKLVTEGSLDGSHLDVQKVAEVKAITSMVMASLVRIDSQIALFCDYGA